MVNLGTLAVQILLQPLIGLILYLIVRWNRAPIKIRLMLRRKYKSIVWNDLISLFDDSYMLLCVTSFINTFNFDGNWSIERVPNNLYCFLTAGLVTLGPLVLLVFTCRKYGELIDK